MAWCPICKAEYEDKDMCPDCSVDLIEGNEKDYTDIFTFPNEEITLNIYNHLMDLKFETVRYYYNAKEEAYHIICQEYEADDARKQMFFFITENLNVELTPTERVALSKFTNSLMGEEHDSDTSAVYVSAKDKYTDVHSSASSLLIVGFIGLIILILDLTGIYRFPFSGTSRVLFLGTMGFVFVLFLISGIMSLKKAKALSAMITDEADMEKEIKTFISEKLDLTCADIETDDDSSDEEKYLARTEYIAAKVKEKYPEADDAFIEHIVEDVYDDIFN